jgi:hypothetical protein
MISYVEDDIKLMGEPKLDPAYAVEMTDRERDALMQADDWSFCLDRFFYMEGPVDQIRSYES